MKEEIKSKNSPLAIGPYSQAIAYQNLVFSSGQLGIEPKTNELEKGIENQTKRVFSNLKELLKAANSSFDNVIKATVYITNMNDFALINEIYSSYFLNDPKPARSVVEVRALPKNALIEIEVIAYQNEKGI